MTSYSQFGEDVVLWEYFGRKSDGFFVEAGANHPTVCSQTWLFEQQGWTGVLVEPLAAKCQLLRQQRPRSRVFQVALGAPEQRGRVQFAVAAGSDALSGLTTHPEVVVERVEEVEVWTLNDVLAEAGNPKLDFVSIDVEGSELEVLRGFDLARHRPTVLLVEDHLQRLAVHRHLARHGYRLVRRTGCNNWYVPRNAPFASPFLEKCGVWKEIHLDTPVRCVRFALKRWRARHRSGQPKSA
jgi:FkbM family methyltransferase